MVFYDIKLLLNTTILIGFAVIIQFIMYAYIRYGVQSNFQASGHHRSEIV